jgi:C4-dicarboxylate-specific signal transduction histidine kinase
VLMGKAPAAIPIVDTQNNDAIVDWRQLRRWNLDERRLPAESQILNRERSMWDRYRQAILIVAGFIALQAIWIVVLMLNRRRLRWTQHSFEQEVEHRVQAEGDSRRLRARLSAAEKQTTLGALAGGIAHEINQPLIAIKNYAQAAKRYLAADPPHGGKLAELVAEMEGEVDRAGAIIRKVRKLLASGRVDAEPVEIDPVQREVMVVMKQEYGRSRSGRARPEGSVSLARWPTRNRTRPDRDAAFPWRCDSWVGPRARTWSSSACSRIFGESACRAWPRRCCGTARIC